MLAVLKDTAGKTRYAVECVAVAEYCHELIFLEIASRSNQAVRAIWANIVKARKGKSLKATEISVDDTAFLWVNPDTKYHHRELTETDAKGQPVFRLIVINQAADRFNREYISAKTEGETSAYFLSTVQRFIDVPFLADWTDTLWTAGQKRNMIRACKGHGCTFWKVDHDATAWQSLVGELFNSNVLSV